MTRLLLGAGVVAALALAAALLALTRTDGATAQVPIPPVVPPAPPAPSQQFVLRVGDSVRVDGAPIGCQITKRGDRPTIECRRDGRLKGTYGTFISGRSVTVARFRSSQTAQTILSATHEGRWRACSRSGPSGKLARLAARGCR